MKFNYVTPKLIISLLFFPLALFADPQLFSSSLEELIIQPDRIFNPNVLSTDSLQYYEKKFNFDWDNYLTIEQNKKHINEIEIFLKINHNFSKLSRADKQALGRILYKLGTFYIHILHQPDLAIERMKTAGELLHTQEEKRWNDNQLAYAYEQKYIKSKSIFDKNKGLYYINKIITENYPHVYKKEVAFAYWVQGLFHEIEKNFGLASTSLSNAITIYEKIHIKDDQYVRAKNRLAGIFLEMNDHDQEAISMLKNVKNYWFTKSSYHLNPHAANNAFYLGKAYLKVGEIKDACQEIEKSIHIYRTVCGDKSTLLVKPYQTLSEAYDRLNNHKLAKVYIEKANQINFYSRSR